MNTSRRPSDPFNGERILGSIISRRSSAENLIKKLDAEIEMLELKLTAWKNAVASLHQLRVSETKENVPSSVR